MEKFELLVSQLLSDYASKKIGKEEIEEGIKKLEEESQKTRRDMRAYDEYLQRCTIPYLGEINRLRIQLQTAIGVI